MRPPRSALHRSNQVAPLVSRLRLALALAIPLALSGWTAGAPTPVGAQDAAPRLLAGHTHEVFALAFSPSGRLLASAGGDQTIRLWEPDTGRDLRILRGHTGPVRALAFSPDGRLLASGSGDATIRLWELASGKETRALSTPFGAIRGLAFSPDGSLVASGGEDGSVRIWDLRAGREIRSMRSRFGIVFAVAFAADGRTLVTGGSDARAHLWDVATGGQRVAFTGHGGGVLALALSPDGSLLATGSADRTVRLWDVVSGRERSVLSGHAGEVQSVAFSADGRGLVSGSADGTVRLQGRTRSEDAALDGHLFYLGRIDGGKSAEDTVALRIPRDRGEATLPMRVEFQEYNGFAPDPLKAMIAIRGAARPRFAYTYQIMDDGSGGSVGNGDGRIQKGEAVDLLLTLRNVGPVPARDTRVEVTSAETPGLAITGGTATLGVLAPEETKTARVTLAVRRDLGEAQLPLRLLIRETGMNAMLSEEIRLPVDSRPPPQIVVTNKLVTVKDASAKVHGGAGWVDVKVNGQVLARRQGRGMSGPVTESENLELSERLALREGRNEIVVTAYDRDSLASTRTVIVRRTVERGRIHAVVIGISKYRTIRPLRFADRDASAFHDFLVTRVGVAKENITLLLNDQATLVNIKRALGTDLRRKAGQQDTVIIYYAGHGAPETDATSQDEDGLEKYVVPHDGDPNAYVSRKVPEATGQNQHPLKKGETEGQLVLGRTR